MIDILALLDSIDRDVSSINGIAQENLPTTGNPGETPSWATRISTLVAQISEDLWDVQKEVQARRHLEANPPIGGSYATRAQETTHDSTTSIGSLSKSTTVATRPADLSKETSTGALSNEESPGEQENKADGDEHVKNPRDRSRQEVAIGPNQATLEDGPRPSQQQAEDRSDPPAKKQKSKTTSQSRFPSMVSVLTDKQAVFRFFKLVHASRQYDDPVIRKFLVSSNDIDRAVALYRLK